MFYWDSTYILVIIGAIIAAMAQSNVNSTYRKYDGMMNRRGLTGREVAAEILRMSGINDVRIEMVGGHLTDHYSPHEKVLRLSPGVFRGTSVSAIGVAAHECGHAIQHQQNYAPLHLRSAAIPLAQFGSTLAWPVILLGIIFGLPHLARFGVVLFTFVLVFQLITLPVEFNASSRAIGILGSSGLLASDELDGAGKVLKAAALTYVAAVAATVLQLLRLFILTRDRD